MSDTSLHQVSDEEYAQRLAAARRNSEAKADQRREHRAVPSLGQRGVRLASARAAILRKPQRTA